MWLFSIKEMPFGSIVKVIKHKKKLKIFFFFQNKIYSHYLKDELFIISSKLTLLFISKNITKTFASNLIAYSNLLKGFLEIWQVGVQLFGVGFRFLILKRKSFSIKLGHSHLIKFYINDGYFLFKSLRKPTRILFFSHDKNSISRLLSYIKSIKNPDSYKGKGLRSFGEILIFKKREKFGS